MAKKKPSPQEIKAKISRSLTRSRKRYLELIQAVDELLTEYYGEGIVEELDRLWDLLYYRFRANPSKETNKKLERLVKELEKLLYGE